MAKKPDIAAELQPVEFYVVPGKEPGTWVTCQGKVTYGHDRWIEDGVRFADRGVAERLAVRHGCDLLSITLTPSLKMIKAAKEQGV